MKKCVLKMLPPVLLGCYQKYPKENFANMPKDLKIPYWVSVVCVMSQDVRGQGNYVRLFFRVSYFSRHVAPPLVSIINYHY